MDKAYTLLEQKKVASVKALTSDGENHPNCTYATSCWCGEKAILLSFYIYISLRTIPILLLRPLRFVLTWVSPIRQSHSQ